MKKYKYMIAGVAAMCATAFLTSCSDYLDTDKYFKDQQSLEHIFNNKNNTLEWLALSYSRLQGDNIEIGHSDNNPTNFCDDMTFNEGNNGDRYRKFKLGEYGDGYSYDTYYKNSWPWSYVAIRQASVFIHNAHANDELTQDEIDVLIGEAHFLRGYFYWLLIRKYGPVPIMPDEGADFSESYDNLSYPRNTFDECVDFICKDMIEAAKRLPDRRDNLNSARPTKGAALAVRAKVLTYAASPLYNGNTEMADFTDKTGRQLISQQYDERKWAVAAAAGKDFLDYNDQAGVYKIHTVGIRKTAEDTSYPTTIIPPKCEPYSSQNFPDGWADIDPFESYRSVFNGELSMAENEEVIFTRGQNNRTNNLIPDGQEGSVEIGVKDLVKHQLPNSLGGWNIHGVTQKQCDAYAMADGTPYDREKVMAQYGPGNEFTTINNKALHPYDHLPDNGIYMGYANREPRFYASVAYSGTIWPGASTTEDRYHNQQIFYYRGEQDGRVNSNERWVNTGIGVMKYVHPYDINVGNNASIRDKADPALRYADLLLLYAEALNNLTTSYEIASWDGTQTYTISRDVNEMHRGVKPVRMRAGVPDYTDEVYADRDQFFNAIVHERQIEFFAENQRYFDLRRWKIAEEHEAEQIYGCNTLMDRRNALQFYNPVRVPKLQTSFSRRQYFWPVSWDELRRNKNLTQAPGWKDYE
jgi:hypothetical protein